MAWGSVEPPTWCKFEVKVSVRVTLWLQRLRMGIPPFSAQHQGSFHCILLRLGQCWFYFWFILILGYLKVMVGIFYSPLGMGFDFFPFTTTNRKFKVAGTDKWSQNRSGWTFPYLSGFWFCSASLFICQIFFRYIF
jgi:hypothetical protein